MKDLLGAQTFLAIFILVSLALVISLVLDEDAPKTASPDIQYERRYTVGK